MEHSHSPHSHDNEHIVDMSLYLNNSAGDTAYRYADFYKRRPPVTWSDELMCVNERLVGILTVISNVLVVLVFVRVLGLTRLASRLIVSIACSNIVVGLAIALHSLAVTNISLTNTPRKCRLLFLLDTTSKALKWSCLACAVLERIIAINLPSQYMASMVIMAPTLISAPWVYWVFRMFIGFAVSQLFFEVDMGFICQHHLMSTILDDPIELVPRPSVIVTVVLTLLLIISRTLHPPHYDNIWEANRLKLEYKTTDIIFRLLYPTFLLCLPATVASYIMAYGSFDTYSLLVTKHICFQITIYNNPVLFFVMLKRKEFRKAFRMIFASREAIRQARLPNYLLVAAETGRRTKSSSVMDSGSYEQRTPVRVSARDDYRSLITENDMMTMPVKKKTKPSTVQEGEEMDLECTPDNREEKRWTPELDS